MRSIIIIGVGQIGSRHLQALKAVKKPLNIIVVDSSNESLKVAKIRYDAMDTRGGKHVLNYTDAIPRDQNFEIAIIATSSKPRAAITEKLLKTNKVRYLILEKILFQKKDDYSKISKLINAKKIKAWVNCPMRVMPFYASLKKEFDGKKITYILYGNQSGMATDLIHHVDFISFMTDSTSLDIDTRLLDKKLKTSKRSGYLETMGSLSVFFKNSSQLLVRCDNNGQSPKIIEIFDEEKRYTIFENKNMATVSKAPDWKIGKLKLNLPYQSQLTTTVVENLFNNGKSNLPTYGESAALHLQAFEPIRKYFKLKHYPFT